MLSTKSIFVPFKVQRDVAALTVVSFTYFWH
jgi:hypothetical protein